MRDVYDSTVDEDQGLRRVVLDVLVHLPQLYGVQAIADV
jgi:hypothetical protein